MEIWIEKIPYYNFSTGSIIPRKSIKYKLCTRNQETSECTIEEYTDRVELVERIIKKSFNGRMFPIDSLSIEMFIEFECILELI